MGAPGGERRPLVHPEPGHAHELRRAGALTSCYTTGFSCQPSRRFASRGCARRACLQTRTDRDVNALVTPLREQIMVIKRVDPLSAAKVFGVLYAAIGLI